MRRLPPLTALPAFEATARLGSVGLAAQELGRTHGAVSKQLRNLADAAGVELFEKAGKGLVPTAEGRAMQAEVARALDILSEAFAEAQRNRPGRAMVLGVSASFAARWLMPRLPRFHAAGPGVAIEFRMAGRVPMEVSSCDVIITWDRLRFPIPTSDGFETLGDVAFGLVHAPGYRVAREGAACRVETRLVPDTNPRAWDAWGALSGIAVTAERESAVPQTALMIEAAAGGMGVAVVERRLVEAELDDERLVAPYGFVTIPGGLGAFVSTHGQANPAARRFIDWMRAEA
ncbi:MAG: LysR substrate-binding domain-containing protein [Pseudomonadota bacterium]